MEQMRTHNVLLHAEWIPTQMGVAASVLPIIPSVLLIRIAYVTAPLVVGKAFADDSFIVTASLPFKRPIRTPLVWTGFCYSPWVSLK